MSNMLRPQTIQDPKPLNWWSDEIKNYFKHKNYESYYNGEKIFFSITSEQSKLAWECLYKSVKESGDITNIIDEALGAWGYVEDAQKQRHLMTKKERQRHADELQETLFKVAKDIKKTYEHNFSYFTVGDVLTLESISHDLDTISKSVMIPTLADDMNEKSTRLRGAVYLARSLNQAIIMTTGKPIYQANSSLISAVFDDKDDEFTPEKIREWCKLGKNRT